MVSAIGSATTGLAAQYQRFARSAARVAANDPPPDLVRETVEQIGAENGASANLSVLKTADQMLGTLFDIWA